MSCCEKLKIDRLKVLRYAKVLACQEANIRNRTIWVIKKYHHLYGYYYEGVDRDPGKDICVYKKFRPGDTMAV